MFHLGGKREVKKILISALVVAMCAGISATAFAVTTPSVQQPAAFSDIAGHEAEGALTLLGAMGIYTGDAGLSGAVKPDDPITRAQFCKIIVTAMGRATTAAGLAGLQPTFTDGATIPTWAWGYVNVAVYMGIINGYADGSFGPNNPVTYAESATMLIRAVSGHLAQVTPGVWPYNYLFYAVDEGFTGGVDVGFANLPASRGDIAEMTVATMQKEKLDKDGEALAGTAQLYMFDDVVAGFDTDEVNFAGQGWTDLAAKFWVVGAADLEGLRNLPVDFTYNASDDVFFLAVTGESDAITGVFDSLDDADNDGPNDTIVLADGTTVPYVDGGSVDVTWNQGAGYIETDLAAGDELVITVDDAGLAANIQATHFLALNYITDFEASVGGTTPVDTWIATFNDPEYDIPADCRVYVNGALADRDTLAVDDAFVVAVSDVSGDPFVLRANRVAIEGTVAGTTTTWPGPIDRVTIDLKAGGSKTYVINHTGSIGLPGEGDVVKYGLDFDGSVYVPVGFESLTPYVVCTQYVVDGSGDATATFDVRGVAVTYNVETDFSGYAENQTYLWIGVDTGTGTAIALAVIVPDNYWEVVSVDAVNGTMTLKSGPTYIFVDDPDLVVYDEDKTYVGLEGVSVGDWLLYDSDSEYPVFELTDEPF
jgi:hypothetical protein